MWPAFGNYRQMQQAVDRIVEIIRKDPNKERIDRVVTRWLKRHLHYLGDSQNWSRIHSLIEDHAMIAENIRTWEEKARAEGIQQGMQQGYERAKAEAEQRLQEVVLNMVQSGLLDEQIISIADISSEQLEAIKLSQSKH